MSDPVGDARPVVVLADDDAAARERLAAELGHRYGHDYRVVACGADGGGSVTTVTRLVEGGEAVALVLVDVELGAASGDGGVDVLARIGAVAPTAKRALLRDAGVPSAARDAAVKRAMGRGLCDLALAKPQGPRDEHFHWLVTDLLRQWGRTAPGAWQAFVVVGERWDPRTAELRDLLERWHVPYGWHPPDAPEGRALLDEHRPARLPLFVVRGGDALEAPSNSAIADLIGFPSVPDHVVDLAVVGGGPAGLAAAVYGASEGLDTVVVEREAFGGQAGTSSRIRNYLGFPFGVSGADLASRAVAQAGLFGVGAVLMRDAVALEPGPPHAVVLSDGQRVRARAVIVSVGARYRRLGVPALEELVGRGVFYGAAVSEAAGVAGEHAVVVGGGNSAGQAAVHLARQAASVSLVVRGQDLRTSMSAYLVEEVTASPRIAVRTGTEVVDGGGTGRLQWLRLRDRASGRADDTEAAGLFLLIGAVPHTDWLPPGVRRDPRGFVCTGADAGDGPDGRPAAALETSVPGVFAAGDCRAGSMKRVASAVGEGAGVVPLVHALLRAG